MTGLRATSVPKRRGRICPGKFSAGAARTGEWLSGSARAVGDRAEVRAVQRGAGHGDGLETGVNLASGLRLRDLARRVSLQRAAEAAPRHRQLIWPRQATLTCIAVTCGWSVRFRCGRTRVGRSGPVRRLPGRSRPKYSVLGHSGPRWSFDALPSEKASVDRPQTRSQHRESATNGSHQEANHELSASRQDLPDLSQGNQGSCHGRPQPRDQQHSRSRRDC
jgi:hypothetical protein